MAPIAYLETAVIYRDDNLRRLSQFPAESVDLIYLDPPFFSNKHYEVIWGDEAEVRSFEDRWEGGIQVYVNWMRERVLEMQRVLKRNGSIYLHCDSHASHYLKAMMDEVFGRERFRNEIIWQRTSSHNDSRKWPHVHDSILFYAGPGYTWHPEYQAHDPSYVARFYRHHDERGQYRLHEIIRTASMGPRPNLAYEYKGYTPQWGWRMIREKVEALDKEGRITWGKSGRPYLKRYLAEQEGTPITSMWSDIPPLSHLASERQGYPTQKPLALLERIIRASSNPGDVVLDPFCGCGTAIVAAHELRRQWIGIDISPTAVNLMRERMRQVGALDVKLVGMPVSAAQLAALKPFEFQNWVIQRMHGTHSPRKSGDMGIDGYSFMLHEPIQVKQSAGVGRNVVDNFETAVERAGKQKGYIVALSFGKGAYEEAARVKAAKGLDIILVNVKDLLTDAPDIVTPETGLMLDLPLPLPAARPPEARPTVEELIASDKARVDAAVV